MTTLTGPRMAPQSGKARQLVVLLHGYGADGNDLIALGGEWQSMMPDTAFASPNAPEPCAGAPMGRQWFPLTMRDMEERWTGVQKAAPVLHQYLDAELAHWGLAPDRLALVGFSQGTMMSLYIGLRRATAPLAIVGYSGMHVMPTMEVDEAGFIGSIKGIPPVLLVHGDRDELIPPQEMFMAAQTLAALEVPVEWHLSQGLGHGIDGDGLRLGGAFLARAFQPKE
ncbi:MAG TPA: prolyl oligopeptidase family serine peptidase [Xanthobacteraceae bacterium]|nr:prolyl oligopeptidase family serine peptidase [Xanthobacteraceae bacterium]